MVCVACRRPLLSAESGTASLRQTAAAPRLHEHSRHHHAQGNLSFLLRLILMCSVLFYCRQVFLVSMFSVLLIVLLVPFFLAIMMLVRVDQFHHSNVAIQ